MSRYPQGVSSFIPAYQPYEVDFNYVNQVLGYKQNQYDQNWKQLNKLYGQLYYADVTHDMSEQKKQALVKDIDFNLRRVSGLDLSLEQNVTQATQVFRPFYEDKDLMYDMAWTKNTAGQKMRGENFKNSNKKEDQSQYWDTGIRAIDYKIQEFKESSYDQIRNVGQASYTPYRNVTKEAQLFAKEMGVDIQTVDFSPDGRYRITTTNGKPLEEPLSRLFESTFGNDPGIVDVYRTQAYVNRKDFAYGNAAQFNGDKNAAEMEYLKSNYNLLKADNKARTANLKAQSSVYDNRIKILQKKYNETNNPQYKDAIESFQLNKDIVDNLIKQSDAAFTADEESKTGTTSSGFTNPYGDIASLRAKVDAGMANKLMNKDINEAASIYAATHSKIDFKADEYKVMEVQHGYDMSKMAQQHKYTMIEKAYDLEIADAKKKIEDGVAELKDGKLVIKDDYNFAESFISADGTVTAGDIDPMEFTQEKEKTFKGQMANSMTGVLDGLREMQSDGIISSEKVKEILGGKTIDQVMKDRENMNASELGAIGGQINSYIKSNKGIGLAINDKLSKAQNFFTALDQVESANLNIKAADEYQRKLASAVSKRANSEGYVGADLLYDSKGNERTKEQWEAAMAKAGLSTKVAPDNMELASKAADLLGMKPVSWLTGWLSSSKNTSAYDELKNKVRDLRTDPNILKQVGNIPFAGGSGFDETGMFSNVSRIKIIPGYQTRNKDIADATIKELNKLDLTDKNNISISFSGTSGTAFETGKTYGNRNADVQMVQKYFADLNFKDEGKIMGNEASIEFYPVAGGKLDRQAIKIRPSAEWLKTNGYITGYDKDGNITTPGIISKEEATNILTNGISVMFPTGSLKNNPVFNAAVYDPIKNYVDQKGSYTYTHPANSDYRYTVKKATNGYDVTNTMQVLNKKTRMPMFTESNDFMTYEADGQGLSKALQIYQQEAYQNMYVLDEFMKLNK